LHAKYLKKSRLGPTKPEDVINPLKVVLMSATLQLKDFISNTRLFDVIPLALKVPVRQFPVSVHFSKRTHDDYLRYAYKKVMSVHKRLPLGGILVFVTGQQEVNYLCKKLQRASKQQTDKKTKKVEGDESSSNPKVDGKEIYEAYDDMFSSEDEINSGPNVDSSDTETESEMDTDWEDNVSDTYETKEEDAPVLELLRSAEGSSVPKASFMDISEGFEVSESVEKWSDATSLKQSIHSVPSFSKCTKPMSVSHGKLRVLPLYAMLPASQQLRVFQDIPEDERLVVVATNVAETSLTLPGIKYVVDTGKQKVKNYNHATGMASYEIQWISKASASQRAGRAGRTGPGHCYRLYSSGAYGKDKLFPEFSEPEIKKVELAGVVLMLKSKGIDEVI
jgi:ATP-dependent RNA helicase DHX37/DHR1